MYIYYTRGRSFSPIYDDDDDDDDGGIMAKIHNIIMVINQ